MDELFKALSEMSRLRILSLLLEYEMCVCEIECVLNLTQSNASRHLTTLRKSGILESYKNAQWTYYRISDEFKKSAPYLWDYLNTELRNLKSYTNDIASYEQCRVNNICCGKLKPH